MSKTFNMEMNIAKAIGILAIVAGHTRWNIFGDLFINYSWHVPLFFFISGYFFKTAIITGGGGQPVKQLLEWCKKIICRYLGRFYAYHFFYGGVIYLIYIWFDKLYGKLPTLKLLILAPVDSTPFNFNAPNWFLYQLAISLCCFAILMAVLYKIKLKTVYTSVLFLLFAIIAILLSPSDFSYVHGVKQIFIKILISLFYIYTGYLYKISLENKIKYNTKTLGIVILIQILSIIIFNNTIDVDLKWARLHHNMSALLCPFTGIYLVLFISKLLAPLVKEGSFIDKIGRNTLHIMANHVFVMFLISICILYIDGKSTADWPAGVLNAYYKMHKYKFLYAFGSLVICTYIGEFLNFTGKNIKNKFINWTNSLKPVKAPCGQRHDAPTKP